MSEALLRVVRGPGDLGTTTRGLLEFLQRATRLESTYLTTIHWDQDKQEVLLANNTGALEIGEGLLVDWSDTLCRRALAGGPSITNDVAGVYPDSASARELGLVCYASVPVTLADGSIFGTLCGAGSRTADFREDTLEIFEFAASLISAQIQRDGRVAAARDRARAAERRFRAQTLDLATAEHKLKTPLTVLAGWAEMLERRNEMSDEEWAEGVVAVRRQVKRLRDAVDALLTTALEHREPAIDLKVMDISPLLRSVVIDHERATPGRDWSVDIADRLYVAVDPAALAQALAHLLDNAVKYSAEATEIAVSAGRTGPQIVITMTDEGIGLPEDADSLFEPWARAGDFRSDSAGLGLYIVRSIVSAHHGTVTGFRRPEGGSRFEICIPSAQV